jgi:hypothetical protein
VKDKTPNWEEAGLTPETVFEAEKAMPFWLKAPAWYLVRTLASELRHELGNVKTTLDIIANDPHLSSMTVTQLGDMPLCEACELLTGRVDKAVKILAFAAKYASAQRKTHK